MRIVYGLQPVREAIRAHGNKIDWVLVQQDAGPKLDALARYAADQGIRVQRGPRSDLDRRTAGGRHQGALAGVPELPLVGVDSLPLEDPRSPEAGSVFIALDGVMDPQNFGAVIRSVVALGASAVIWPEHSSAPLSPATFRASAGAVEHATLCRVPSLPDALRTLTDRGATAVALDAQGPVELGELKLTGPVVIVVGAEDKGVRRPVRQACQHVARLPMAGTIGSLNASVAAALALYEVLRQRQQAQR
ncbi:23S rRNA (guanosine(2251)-2'-O)-methyltransferase RlmB [Chondromyces apiculatus]|uniref:TrmH family tRNA/rRNA methyltransferase YacO n=1 Tax=Chondromyces apiculatus DSM 436 TaxID=1192034 RepID=A0A017T0C3_9BACT|nr:23S rRNA (guanosine(2251)-2'-O)-methyltransferase RlmB [Chondromyces apiculatus]EYF02452.1 TrmH family tRNA/rRNA methyltransferase YacO [Chondromyces apiculatus DSM 436]